jgi:hypothetical protein
MRFMPILSAERFPRLITVRGGGTLTDEHHRLRAEWAPCTEHALSEGPHRPGADRPLTPRVGSVDCWAGLLGDDVSEDLAESQPDAWSGLHA